LFNQLDEGLYVLLALLIMGPKLYPCTLLCPEGLEPNGDENASNPEMGDCWNCDAAPPVPPKFEELGIVELANGGLPRVVPAAIDNRNGFAVPVC